MGSPRKDNDTAVIYLMMTTTPKNDDDRRLCFQLCQRRTWVLGLHVYRMKVAKCLAVYHKSKRHCGRFHKGAQRRLRRRTLQREIWIKPWFEGSYALVRKP